MVTLDVLDAGSNPVALDLEEVTLLGVEEDEWGGTLHRLDAARFAECGSRHATREEEAGSLSQRHHYTLCWYCFPRS